MKKIIPTIYNVSNILKARSLTQIMLPDNVFSPCL